MTDDTTNITSPAPYYGLSEDRFPGVLFIAPDRSVRLAQEVIGMDATRLVLQRPKSNSDGSAWLNLGTSQTVAGLIAETERLGLNAAALQVFLSTLPTDTAA
jgi:hypothetical protein